MIKQVFQEKREGVTVLLKDAWKAAVSSTAEAVLGKTFDSREGLLTIPVKTKYADDVAECEAAMSVLDEQKIFTNQYITDNFIDVH